MTILVDGGILYEPLRRMRIRHPARVFVLALLAVSPALAQLKADVNAAAAGLGDASGSSAVIAPPPLGASYRFIAPSPAAPSLIPSAFPPAGLFAVAPAVGASAAVPARLEPAVPAAGLQLSAAAVHPAAAAGAAAPRAARAPPAAAAQSAAISGAPGADAGKRTEASPEIPVESGRVQFDQAAAHSASEEVPVAEPSVGAARPSALAPASDRPSPAEKKILEKIAKELGPVVDAAEAPALYAAIETAFGRLSAAQEKLFPSGTVPVNRVRIIDTPVINAFVYPLRNSGVRRSNNMVFITTGLLKKMLEADPAQLKDGMIRIVGILAHELAHPLDDVDAQGVLNNYGREAGGQAREIRADSEGAMIAKEAGYPASSVYQSLERLFAAAPAKGGSLAAMASTHPENELRLVMQRILLTLDRYNRGARPARFPDEVPASALADLDRIDKGARLGRFARPRGLADALERLKQVPLLKRTDDDKVVEFNRILLSVDALLASRSSALDDEDFRVFTEIARFVARPDSPKLLDRESMNRLFTAETHSKEFLAYPSHETFMKKIPVYQSARYRAWLAENFFSKTEGYGEVERAIHALAKIAPTDVVFDVFGRKLADVLPATLRGGVNLRYAYEHSLAAGQSIEFKIRLALLFHREIAPLLSDAERLAFYTDQITEYSYVVPQMNASRPRNTAKGLSNEAALFWNDPRLGSLRDEYRVMLRSVWENRGYYATLDLVAPFNRFDWDTIFQVVGVDPGAGRSQLRQGVKKFASTPKYAAMLKTIRDSDVKLLKLGRGSGRDLAWLDDTLAPALSGDGNEILKTDPELRAFGRKLFVQAYYASRPALFRRLYRQALAASLAGTSPPADVAELGRAHREIVDALLGGGERAGAFALADLQAEVLAASSLPSEVRRDLLRAVFLDGYVEARQIKGLTYENAGEWLGDRTETGKILGVLVSQGVVDDAHDLLKRLLDREDFRVRARKDGFTRYASAASGLKADLQSGLKTQFERAATDGEKAALLANWAATVLDPADGDYAAPEAINTPELRRLKEQVVELAAPLKMELAESLAIFRPLTGSGATPATDAFFRRHVEPIFEEPAAEAADLSMPEILESKRISSAELQLSLARRTLEPEIKRLETSAATPADLSRLLDTLNGYVRHGSQHKDDFLESLAWRLNLTGRELGAFIEDEKSYNWRKANPLLLRFGSGLSAEIGRLSERARGEFIRFLLAPEGGRLPDALFKELERNIFQAALDANSAKDYPSSPATVREESERAAELMKLEIEAALIDASPFERIPLYELLLSAGPAALKNSAGYPYDVMREFLGYEENSAEEKMLAAFLAVVPSHERTVSLAYMLSQAGRNKSSVKNLFEVFQTVGVKFGQVSSTWKLFGEEVSRETASLKNDARPMTKDEIMTEARRELTPEEFARIKRVVKVIGSASIKTVVLVELQDGRQVAMLLRRPHAAEQIESNLRLGSEFLKELDRRGLSDASAMFEIVLEAVREQLKSELSLTREAASLRAAKTHYDRLNVSMSAELGPWRFRVPALIDGFAVRDTILFVEAAHGTTYDRLAPEVQAQAGPLIADSSLALLFRDGWFDADRHTGNQLIDPAAHLIYPLDFGQTSEFTRTAFWRSDDRYELAQFLRALSAGDADGVLRHGLVMSDRNPRDVGALRAKIRLILAGEGELRDRIVSLVAAFADAGAPLDGRFTFGAFKGLMTLAGENYLPDAAFRESLGREIAALLRRKFPRALRDARR